MKTQDVNRVVAFQKNQDQEELQKVAHLKNHQEIKSLERIMMIID